MARNLDPKCKQCRRSGEKLFLKGERCHTQKCSMVRRPYPPGPGGADNARGRGRSEFAKQSLEKQKLRKVYGLLEKQFRRTFDRAAQQKGVIGDNLMRLLEIRLDNVVFRLGFAASRDAARQLVGHGFIIVNGKRVSIPSYEVKQGDIVGVHENRSKRKNMEILSKSLDKKGVPSWVELDPKAMSAKIMSLPGKDAVADMTVDIKAIVELYSK